MNDDKFASLPVEFSVIKSYESKDVRFMDVTIDVLHTGRNFNGSIFLKEVVDKCVDSIKNTPILGYIIVDDEGNTVDYKDHRFKLVQNKNGLRYMYDGSSYGVIPESCNPRWVTKECSDGVEREFLRVDGIMWTKFERAVEIFKRDGTKGQSMELAAGYDGYENPDGTFTFTNFQFDGCCILSTTDPGIQPAMIDSVVTANFSIKSVANTIKDMLNEYKQIVYNQDVSSFQDKIKEGGINTLDMKNEILTKYNLKMEDLDFTVSETMSDDEFENKVNVFVETKKEQQFTLERQFCDTLREVISQEKYIYPDYPEWGEFTRYWLIDYDRDKSEVYAEDAADYKLYGFTYTVSGDNVTVNFDSKKRMKWAIEAFNEGEDTGIVFEHEKQLLNLFDTYNANFMKLKQDLDDTKTQYNTAISERDNKICEFNTLKEQFDSVSEAYNKILIDEVFASFDKELGDIEEYKELKNTASSFATVEELENACYTIFGKKAATFSRRNTGANTVRLVGSSMNNHNDSENTFDYGGIREKFLKK